MMHVPVQQHRGYAEQRAAAVAVHYRLRAPQTRTRALPAPASDEPPVVRTRWADRPLWERSPIKFNDHEIAYQMYLARQACSPAIGYLRKRCEEIGVDLGDLAMEGHKRKFAAPRQLLMWELRTILGMSFPRIGRIFDRDHTTVMYAVRKIEAQRGG